MNLDFVYLIIIFTLLVLLITFGDYFDNTGLTYFISTKNNNVSLNSIAATIDI